MKIVVTSDTHGYLPDIEPCDVFIHCGDFSPIQYDRDMIAMYDWMSDEFDSWLGKIESKVNIVIPGNHDFVCESTDAGYALKNAKYLEGDSFEFEGVKFFGFPWVTLWKGWAFTCTDDFILHNKVIDIPDDTNILISHGPLFGILDLAKGIENVGSRSLYNKVVKMDKLQYLLHGHIHESAGSTEINNLKIFNASYVDERYQPKNEPIVLEI